MMQTPKNPILGMALVMVIGCLAAYSEVFILKDGTRVEGVLLSQDETSYLLEVQVTKGIKDEKRLAKADVASVERTAADLKAFEEISKLVPTPDGLTPEEYNARIDQILGFVTKYPSSTEVAKTRPMLATLRMELKEIKEGGMKLNGILHDAEAYRANALEMDASRQAQQIRRTLASGHYLIGLRDFAEFEKEYSSTLPYQEMIPVIIDAIGAYTSQISEMLSTLEQRVKEREAGLERMDSKDREISERAIAAQEDTLNERFNMQRQTRIAWVTPHPFHKGSMDYTISQAKIEMRRLETRRTQKFIDGGAVYRKVMALAKEGIDRRGADMAMREVATSRMGKKYADMLKQALDANIILTEREKKEKEKKELLNNNKE